LDNDLPLTLGVMPGWVSTGPTFDVSDIRIYNTALPDELIASEYCQSEISNTDPYNDYLIGYWPAAEGSGNKLVNHSVIGQGKDFIFTKTNPWNLLIPNFCNTPDEEDSNALFMQNTDIASQIFYWMQIKTSSTWELEGTVWLSKYEQEFIK